MLEAILLATALFWEPNFLFCPRYILNLAKKFELKTKSLKIDVVKEQKRQIWVNKTITELDVLFTSNPDWWQSTTVIFA